MREPTTSYSYCGKLLPPSEVLYTAKGDVICQACTTAAEVGFLLLILQGLSELIKRIAFLRGLIPDPLEKEHDISPEEQLAAEIRRQRGEAA